MFRVEANAAAMMRAVHENGGFGSPEERGDRAFFPCVHAVPATADFRVIAAPREPLDHIRSQEARSTENDNFFHSSFPILALARRVVRGPYFPTRHRTAMLQTPLTHFGNSPSHPSFRP